MDVFTYTFKCLLYSTNFKSYKAFCNLDSKKNQYIFIDKKANEGNTDVISNWLILKQLHNGLQRPLTSRDDVTEELGVISSSVASYLQPLPDGSLQILMS